MLLERIDADILKPTDPRVGSARDNATSTSALKVTSGTNSASFATLFVTFVPILIYAAICLTIFIILRRKYPRVYAPRSFLTSLEPQYVLRPALHRINEFCGLERN